MLLSTDDLFSSWERILIIINSVTWSSTWIWICTSAHRGIPVSSLCCYCCFSVVLHVYTSSPFITVLRKCFLPHLIFCVFTLYRQTILGILNQNPLWTKKDNNFHIFKCFLYLFSKCKKLIMSLLNAMLLCIYYIVYFLIYFVIFKKSLFKLTKFKITIFYFYIL